MLLVDLQFNSNRLSTYTMNHELSTINYDLASVVSLNIFIKWNFELVFYIFIPLVFQNIQSIPEIPGVGIGKSAKQTIPQGKYITVIGICIRANIMMMDLMHIRRYKQQTNRFIDPERHPDIGMIKMGKQGGGTPVQKIHSYGQAK